MIIKNTHLTDEQVTSFISMGSAMGFLVTLPLPGSYPTELKQCGINERSAPRNQLLGCIMTLPSGSQLALETVFYDTKDNQDNGDLHIVNFESKVLTSHYQGWGTWTQFYGNKHWEFKACLRAGSSTSI